MSALFNFFKKNEEVYIKKWMQRMHLLFPDSTFALKNDKDILIIVCDDYTEKKQEFRDIALDFLISFDKLYKSKDIIIVSDKDAFYHFDDFDYSIGQHTIGNERILIKGFKVDVVSNIQDISLDVSFTSKNIDNVDVKENEWETFDYLPHSYCI